MDTKHSIALWVDLARSANAQGVWSKRLGLEHSAKARFAERDRYMAGARHTKAMAWAF